MANNDNKDVEIPQMFTHSIKLSETQKGVRIDVHVYANDRKTAIIEALETYGNMRLNCEQNNIPLAPFEIKK